MSTLSATLSAHFDELLEIETKACKICKEEKPLDEYPNHKAYIDGKNSLCLSCCSAAKKLLYDLKKTAPPKPDGCECCGRDPLKLTYKAHWVLDHDHITKLFRGWLCDDCNLAIGKLGDTLKGVMNAVRYFKSRGLG